MRAIVGLIVVFHIMTMYGVMALGVVQFINNTVGPNGFALDNSAGFLRDDINTSNGRIFAR